MTREEILEAVSRGDSLAGKDFSGVNLWNATLSGNCLIDTDLSGANLSYAELNTVDFSGANLTNATLQNAFLIGTDLTRAKMEGIYMKDAKCDGTRFPPHILPILPALLLGAINTLSDPENEEGGHEKWDEDDGRFEALFGVDEGM